jgi:hypothetical protein
MITYYRQQLKTLKTTIGNIAATSNVYNVVDPLYTFWV